jgi:predicted dehydrogenase
MRYGVIGTGYWGEKHARVAAELADDGVLDAVVVCDSDESRASAVAAEHGLPYETDASRLDVDAATVATPSPTHEPIATGLLDAGVDLLVEKPLALTSADAWAIVDAAEANDCSLGVGHIFRYHPALGELKRLVDEGALGEITQLHTTRFSFRVPRETTGVLYSLAVHDVDVYDYLLGRRPDAVLCTMDSTVREGIEESAMLSLTYGSTRGVIHASWQQPVFGKRRDLAVVGTERSAYVDYLADTTVELHDTRLSTAADGGLSVDDDGVDVREAPAHEPLKREVESFVAAARAGRDPEASGRVGARAIEVLERAEQSAAQRDVVDVSVPASPRN